MIAATRWSRVLAAQAPDPAGRVALAELLEAYRTALSAFAQRRGLDAEATEDAIQGFAVKLLAQGGIVGAAPERGRFRNYLLAAFRHHLGDEQRRAHAAKRGGCEATLPLEDDTDHAAAQEQPEAAFDRAWAMAVVRGTMRQLREEYACKGRASLFDAVAPRLMATTPLATDADAECRAGMSPQAFKVALHRARRRFGQLLRARVAETVDPPSPATIAEELRELTKFLIDTAWVGATEPS